MSTLKISGTIKEILPEEKIKDHTKQSVVITYGSQYKKDACFDLWNDSADILHRLNEGDKVEVTFLPESREWNGKWFTNNKASSIVKEGEKAAVKNPAIQKGKPTQNVSFDDDNDDAPF